MTFPGRAQKFSLGNLDFWGAFGATAPQYKSKIKVIQIAMYSIPFDSKFNSKKHFLLALFMKINISGGNQE